MKGKAYPKQLKAQAIAALIAGESATDVADRLNLPRTSVRNWKLTLGPEKLAEVSRNTAGRLDDLLCDCLESNLGSLAAQAEAAGDPEWLRRQSGKDLAAFYEGIFENTLSLLDMTEGLRR